MTSPFRRIVPWNPPSDEKYTGESYAGNPVSFPIHDESLVPSNYDEDTSFFSTTTVEGYGSFTPTVSGGRSSQPVVVSGNNHTKSGAALIVTEVPEISFKNKSPSGTLDRNSGFKFKFLNRSLPSLVSTSKRPWHHQLTVRVPVDTSLEST